MSLTPHIFGSADAGEFAMFVIALLYLTVTAVAIVLHRREKAWIPIAILSALMGLMYETHDLGILALSVLGMLTAGMTGYAILRGRLFSYGQRFACCLAVVAIYLSSCVVAIIVGRHLSAARFCWLLIVPFPVGFLVGYVAKGGRWLWRLGSDAAAVTPSRAPQQRSEEVATVINMLKEEKISAGDAAQLLNALESDSPPADSRPVGKPIVISLIATLLIVVGFVLPWNQATFSHGPLPKIMQGHWPGFRGGSSLRLYQSGPNLGWTGWVILLLGVLPAILSCIPALDKYLRQGMLRLVLSAMGGAFAGALAVQILLGGGLPHIGVWLVLAGFTIQIASAVRQSGLADLRHDGQACMDS